MTVRILTRIVSPVSKSGRLTLKCQFSYQSLVPDQTQRLWEYPQLVLLLWAYKELVNAWLISWRQSVEVHWAPDPPQAKVFFNRHYKWWRQRGCCCVCRWLAWWVFWCYWKDWCLLGHAHQHPYHQDLHSPQRALCSWPHRLGAPWFCYFFCIWKLQHLLIVIADLILVFVLVAFYRLSNDLSNANFYLQFYRWFLYNWCTDLKK